MILSIKTKLLISFTTMLILFIIINSLILPYTEIRIYFSIMSMVTIILSTIYTLYINKVAFLPIEKIDKFLTKIIMEGEFSNRLKISGGKEINRLVNTINMLLSELENLIQKERKIFENKLEAFKLEYNKKIEDFLNITKSIVLTWSIDGKVKKINNYGLNLLGFSDLEILEKNIEEIFKISIHDLFQKKSHISEIVKKDGSKIWIKWTHKIIEENGEIVIISIGEDITEKINIKNLEIKKARITNNFYEKLISTRDSLNEILEVVINESIQLTESKSGLLWILEGNEGWACIIKNGIKEIINLSSINLKNKIFEIKEPIIENSSYIYIPEIDFKTNRYLIIPCNLKNIKAGILVCDKDFNYDNEDLEIINLISKYFILTIERYKLEEKFRKNIEEIITIFDSIDNPIYVVDINTHEILYANKYLCNILSENPIGKICYKELKNSNKPCEYCINDALLKQGIFKWDEYNEKLKKYYSNISRLIKWPDGRIVKFEYAIDISDRKYLEEQLKNKIIELENYSRNLENIVEEKSKALVEKERLATIGEMALMIGHDLRNPLQAIVYSLYLIKKNNGNSIEKYIESISNSVEYMNKIVSDLQDFARPIKMKVKNEKIKQVFENTLSLVKIPDNIKLIIDVDSNIEGEIDERLISRALINLIINAIQAMPNGGILRLSAKIENNWIKIIIEDTGMGMSKEVLNNLFKPFYTTKPKGMGLGLCIVKRFIEEHGGKIFVESELGKGTKFTIEIPRKIQY
ncbi:MAG: ATP-binding protein [Candidatus Methanomethylicaceae archaeon]